jgi:hypothetical protein
MELGIASDASCQLTLPFYSLSIFGKERKVKILDGSLFIL